MTIFFLLGLTGANPTGSPWHMVSIDLSRDLPLSGIIFVDDKVGWMCAGRNTILKTTDGGNKWSISRTNLAAATTEVARLWFADENRGWAVGAIDQQPTIWRTINGGLAWSIEQQWPRAYTGSVGAVLDIRFVDNMSGWAVGFNGLNATILATSDGGQRWSTQYSGREITGQFNLVRFTDARHGWTLSPMGVMQTEDGGESWSLRYFDGGLLNDLAVVGPSEAWVSGAWGWLLHTRNGVTWSQVKLGGLVKEGYLGWVGFANQDVGWASGTKGEILMTRDGGKTWRQDFPKERIVGSEMSTGEMAITNSNVFIIANPGHLLVRSIN